MLTQLFRDSEAAQCHLLPLIASTLIHSSVRSFIRPFILFIIHPYLCSHGRLFLGSLPDYGMEPVMVTGPALFHQYSNLLVQPDLNIVDATPWGKTPL